MMDDYCPKCGERVDRGLSDVMGKAPCENCGELVEPISDSGDAEMGKKALHPIRCTKCGTKVYLVGLHMGRYTDGVLAACSCTSLESIPYELGEAELPHRWEIEHQFEAFPEPDTDREMTEAEKRGLSEWSGLGND